MNRRDYLLQATVFATSLITAQAALAQANPADFPTQPVKIVVGYSAGGTTDILARAVAEQLGIVLKQSVIIDNRPGAAGSLAAGIVENAAPNGYTLLMATVSSHGINPALYKKLEYRPVAGFEPISMVASSPLVLVANKALPVNSVQDLIDLARKQPGALNSASSGNGSPGHLAGLLFARDAKIDVVDVPYKGGAQANMSTIAGETQYSFATLPAVLPQIKAGALKALAITTKSRVKDLPNTPALAELSTFPNYEVNTWNALLAPAGTPDVIIQRLNQALLVAMKSPALRERFSREGAEATTTTPAETKAHIQSEMQKWGATIAGLKIKM